MNRKNSTISRIGKMPDRKLHNRLGFGTCDVVGAGDRAGLDLGLHQLHQPGALTVEPLGGDLLAGVGRRLDLLVAVDERHRLHVPGLQLPAPSSRCRRRL